MARPQLENGHTQIANELLEQLMATHLAPNNWQVLICIIRKTYGFHKKVDYIANSQIVEATGLCKAVVSRALGNLNDMHLIDRKGKYIGLQKDWEQWKELAKPSTPDTKLAELQTNGKLAIPSTEVSNFANQLAVSSTKVSSPRVTQKIKDTLTKDTLQKKQYGEFNNVRLTDEEYQKLLDKFGESGVGTWIENLALYIASKGDKYKNHYATILSWHNKDKKGGQGGTHRQNSRKLPDRHSYSDPDDL